MNSTKQNVQPTVTPATANNFVALSQMQMFNLLAAERGATFITFVAHTSPKMRKTNNPWANNAVKIAKVNGQVNFHYDAAVLRALAKEGKSETDFQKGESWHEPVKRPDGTLTPFCQHKTKGTYYLRFRLIGSVDSRYETLDGQPIDANEIDPFLQKSDYSNQGLDDPIKFLVYGLENIKQLTLNGVNYLIS